MPHLESAVKLQSINLRQPAWIFVPCLYFVFHKIVQKSYDKLFCPALRRPGQKSLSKEFNFNFKNILVFYYEVDVFMSQ